VSVLVVDYGSGNLRSAAKALERAAAEAVQPPSRRPAAHIAHLPTGS
jgi:imidazoleglycerol phosphate synthase glutamine amidotransferase subunit HisH